MTLHKDGKNILFECDGCDEQLNTGTNDFDDARTSLKNDKWKTERVAGEWLHLCPKCQKKGRK